MERKTIIIIDLKKTLKLIGNQKIDSKNITNENNPIIMGIIFHKNNK